MGRTRTQVFLSMLKGLLCAVVLTLLLMAAVAALALGVRISDGALTALNQLMKLLSILLGVTVAVGRGGRRGDGFTCLFAGSGAGFPHEHL